jgi:hypothetical protein
LKHLTKIFITVKSPLMNTSQLWTMNTIFGPDSTENLYIMNDYLLTVDKISAFILTLAAR